MLTALAGRREEPVAGEPRPREAVGVAAGQRVAAVDGRRQGPFLRLLPWPFVAGSTVEILRDDMAQ